MDIGIVGHGVVGKAIAFGFAKLGHKVNVHDIKMDTSLDDLLETQINYICVPTNSKEDGSCDISIVEQVIGDLTGKRYAGIIAIKSTVPPGTTNRLIDQYGANICFVPEFLRERCAIADFTENHDVCVIGTDLEHCFQIVRKSHGTYPDKVLRCSPEEAEACKYFVNAYNATLVTFANAFYELCTKIGVDYSVVKNICINRNHISDDYLTCNENMRSFGGTCLPKDVRSLAFMCKKRGVKVDFFDSILTENAKYKTTVFDGMRK